MMNHQLNLNTKNVPFGVVVFNSDWLIIDANEQVERILKFDVDQIIGKVWDKLPFKFISKDGVELYLSKHPLVEKLLNGEDVVDEVIGIVDVFSRDVIWVNVSVLTESSHQPSMSEPRQMTMFLSDVTDLVKINITIEDIIEKINLGVWQWNIVTGGAIYGEPWAEMLGYTLDELKPINIDVWRRLAHPDDLELFEKKLERHFSKKTPQYDGVIRMRHKNGHWVWVHDIGKVTQWSEHGEPLYMTGIHHDITEYKKTEHQLSQKIEYGKILHDISAKFINTHDIDATITESFSKLASLTYASRVYLFRFDSEKQTMSNTHEWCNKGVSSQKDILQGLPLSSFPWWIKKLSNGEIINIPDVSKMEDEAKSEKEILEKQEIKSVFALPVIIKQSLVGFIGFDNVNSTNNWLIDDIDFFLTTVSVFSYALDRQQIEEDLNRNYLNFRAYFDLNSDFVLILNEQAEIIDINKQITKVLGYTPNDLIGRHALTLHPPEYYEKAEEIFKGMLEGDVNICPLPILTKSGEKLLVETTLSKGVWDGKSVLFAVSKDISEKVMSLEKYEKIFQNIPTLAGLIDTATGKYIEVNKVFMQKLGYTYDEVINNRVVDLFKIDTTSHKYLSSILLEKGFIEDFETVFYHKDGSAIDVLSFATNISLLDKKYILTLATDISQTKQYERELIDAKRKAEESDRLKSAFLATMNHELRTPLNHIIGFSSMLPDMVEDASIKEFLKLIHTSGLNLLNIIEDVLDLAMIDQSHVKIREDCVYVRDIYLELRNQLQEIVFVSDKNKDILLDFKIDSRVLTKQIITDKSKVMQVVSNLIKNAVKFTHKGKIGLELKLNEDNLVSIIVKDTGIGIPEDKRDVIFEFFRQVDDSNTRQYEGIGIGLAISQKIALVMGGEINVKSEVDVGSEFTFSFPVELCSDSCTLNKEETQHIEMPSLLGKKVLIVEDDPVGMGMMENMILPTECQIFKATNGVEALETIFEDPSIQLVLMDLKMPEMDGFEATRKIRKQMPYLPIIALTAYSLQRDREKALQAGCNDIITKPVNRAMLLRKMENYLKS